MENNKPLSVSETNELIKTIAATHIGQKIYIKGELSNMKRSNGHLYFTLKDALANISGVYWRFNSNAFNNGDIVTVGGKISFFTKQGTYNITASEMDKCDGVGDINTKYQKLKDEFDQKGYYTKKRNFPQKIRNIALLTSTEGAALQDILYVLNTNNFIGNVYIKNSIVQGNGCSKSVKEGIEHFNKMKDKYNLDILVIARGGGSTEDLWGYSTEEVVKAVYESDVFTISAIGHEIDFMLSDFAADFRAPTPSIAGETIIKEQKKEFDKMTQIYEKLKKLEYSILSQVSSLESKLNYCVNSHRLCNPINFIEGEIEKIENYKRRIKDRILYNINNSIHELDKLKIKNNVNNIKKITQKGYTLITDEEDNLIESSIEFKKKLKDNSKMKIMFYDGEVYLNE